MQFSLSSPTGKKILEAKTYPAFKKALIESDCTRCPLSVGRHHIVVDRGNPEAKVLIVGEAPGENEDLQGKAFVGRGGKLLDTLAKEVGIDTNKDTLIANVAKCRPPENRAPKQEEVDTCIPYLHKQISLMKPAFIVLLGATALKRLIPEKAGSAMGGEVGKTFTHPGFPDSEFMVLYHPAYILRDPRKKPLMLEHLKELKRLLSKKKILV